MTKVALEVMAKTLDNLRKDLTAEKAAHLSAKWQRELERPATCWT